MFDCVCALLLVSLLYVSCGLSVFVGFRFAIPNIFDSIIPSYASDSMDIEYIYSMSMSDTFLVGTAEGNPRKFLDPRAGSGSSVYEKLAYADSIS